LSHKSFSSKFGEIRIKILFTPKKVPAPTLIAWKRVPFMTSELEAYPLGGGYSGSG